jgi:hypothetical protein
MYQRPFYCIDCRHMRWPGDCTHRRVQMHPGLEAVNLKALHMDKCPTCGFEPKACRCHQFARAGEANKNRLGVPNVWAPSDAVVEIAHRTKGANGDLVTDGEWVGCAPFVFFSPRYAVEHPGLGKIVVKPAMRSILQAATNHTFEVVQLGIKLESKEPCADSEYRNCIIRECRTAIGICYYQQCFLDVFDGQILAGVFSQSSHDGVYLVVRNHFGGMVGVVANYLMRDRETWIEVR